MGLGSGRSPRGRRNHYVCRYVGQRLGSISAWAEEPWPRWAHTLGSRVDLRVGGGTQPITRQWRESRGRSPRGRRNPRPKSCGVVYARSISAWAEEPLPLKWLNLLHLSKNTSQCETGLRTRREPSCSTRSFGASPRVSTLSPPGAPASRHVITMLPVCI